MSTTFDRRTDWNERRTQDTTADMLYRLLAAIQLEHSGPISQALLRVELAAAEHLQAIGFRVEDQQT